MKRIKTKRKDSKRKLLNELKLLNGHSAEGGAVGGGCSGLG